LYPVLPKNLILAASGRQCRRVRCQAPAARWMSNSFSAIDHHTSSHWQHEHPHRCLLLRATPRQRGWRACQSLPLSLPCLPAKDRQGLRQNKWPSAASRANTSGSATKARTRDSASARPAAPRCTTRSTKCRGWWPYPSGASPTRPFQHRPSRCTRSACTDGWACPQRSSTWRSAERRPINRRGAARLEQQPRCGVPGRGVSPVASTSLSTACIAVLTQCRDEPDTAHWLLVRPTTLAH
jgi:hypothetical protein